MRLWNYELIYPTNCGTFLSQTDLSIMSLHEARKLISNRTESVLFSRTRTTTRTSFGLRSYRVFFKKRHPRRFIKIVVVFFFSPENLVWLFLLKEVCKPSPDRRLIKLRKTFDNLFTPILKLVIEWQRLPRFPAKIAPVNARALQPVLCT